MKADFHITCMWQDEDTDLKSTHMSGIFLLCIPTWAQNLNAGPSPPENTRPIKIYTNPIPYEYNT